MKSNSENKRMNKPTLHQRNQRTNALKSILKNRGDAVNEAQEDLTTSILNNNPPNNFTNNPLSNYVHTIELFHKLISKELSKAAKELVIEEQELQAWIDLQIEVPAKTILSLLRTMQSLQLDPLNEEIGFIQHEGGSWQTFISIEGCAKLLNRHAQFNGITFSQSETTIEGVPEWIECTIYRKDRILPICVREHYAEVKGATPIWQKMPRRMLRHRALQQCVRLAF